MQSRYIVDSRSISSEEFDGEVVAVNFATGKYYGMKGCADRIWHYFSAPRTEDEVVTFVAQAFRADETEVGTPVRDFVRQLVEEGILLRTETEPVGVNEPSVTGNTPFEPPHLEVHNDLQDLILLDPVHDTDPAQGWPLRRSGSDA